MKILYTDKRRQVTKAVYLMFLSNEKRVTF